MRIKRVRYLRGPNYYASEPTICVEVDLDPAEQEPLTLMPSRADQLLELLDGLPWLAAHSCPFYSPSRLSERLAIGTSIGDVLEHLSVAIQRQAGIAVGCIMPLERTRCGSYFMAFRYREPDAGFYAFQAATEILHALLTRGGEVAIKPHIDRTAALYHEQRLDPSTQAISDAATARRIPVQRVGEGNLLRLGTGSKQKFAQATVTSQTSLLATEVAHDRQRTREALQAINLPVPDGRVVTNQEEVLVAARELSYPVVIKPLDRRQEQPVVTGIENEQDLLEAFLNMHRPGTSYVVESYAGGADYRLLIVNWGFAAAARCVPPTVVGDGQRSIAELIERENSRPERGTGPEGVLIGLPHDEQVESFLARGGLALDSVPEAGQTVQLLGAADLSKGGTSVDVTDQVHHSQRRLAIRAARAVGLDVAGVDVISKDLSLPVELAGTAILGVSAAPDVRMHLYPTAGQARDIGGAIADYLFVDARDAAVPIVAVTGTNGKTTTTRLIAHLLKEDGRTVGFTCTDGIWIGDERIEEGDCSGPQSAAKVLANPEVDLAVLEVARGGILRSGLPFRQCDVGVVTNVAADHLGLDGIETLEQLRRVKGVIPASVAPSGCAVLNADDENVALMRLHTPGRVVFFSLDPHNPHIVAAQNGNGSAWYLDGDQIIHLEEGIAKQFIGIDRVPLAFGGIVRHNIANVLGALAAAASLGVSEDRLRELLSSFRATVEQNKGRFNVFEVADRTLIVDYGHNPHGLRAMFTAVESLGERRVLTVFSAPGDRPNESILEMGRIIGAGSDVLIIKEETDRRGREPLEAAALLRGAAGEDGLRCGLIESGFDECGAFREAWRLSEPGDILLLFYVEFQCVQQLLAEITVPGSGAPDAGADIAQPDLS